MSALGSSELLSCCLTRLAANHFIGVLDAFALVRVGLAERADLGSGLTDFLLVDAGDRDVAALRLDDDLDPCRDRETHRMRVTELEDDFLPFDLGAVADTNDVELALEPVGHAANVVGHESPHEAVERTRSSLVVRACELHGVVLDLHADARNDRG